VRRRETGCEVEPRAPPARSFWRLWSRSRTWSRKITTGSERVPRAASRAGRVGIRSYRKPWDEVLRSLKL